MTFGRRLAKLESALSPRAAVLLWVGEAQAFPSLPAYVGWLVDQPREAHPLVRIPEQVEAGTRQALRGERRDDISRAVRQAVGELVFLYALVVRINVATDEAIRFESLRLAALVFRMRELMLRAELADMRPAPCSVTPILPCASRNASCELQVRLSRVRLIPRTPTSSPLHRRPNMASQDPGAGSNDKDILSPREKALLAEAVILARGGLVDEADLDEVIEWARRVRIDLILLDSVLEGFTTVWMENGKPMFQRTGKVHLDGSPKRTN